MSTVLRGGRTKRIRDLRHDSLSVFGIARDQSSDDIKEITDLLTAEGFVHRNKGEYPTLSVTDLGRRVLRERSRIKLSRPVQVQRRRHVASDETDDHDPGLFERLRELRLQIAREQDVPAFVVFYDTTLRNMARHLPTNADEFGQVSGVGSAKLRQYGDRFSGCDQGLSSK